MIGKALKDIRRQYALGKLKKTGRLPDMNLDIPVGARHIIRFKIANRLKDRDPSSPKCDIASIYKAFAATYRTLAAMYVRMDYSVRSNSRLGSADIKAAEKADAIMLAGEFTHEVLKYRVKLWPLGFSIRDCAEITTHLFPLASQKQLVSSLPAAQVGVSKRSIITRTKEAYHIKVTNINDKAQQNNRANPDLIESSQRRTFERKATIPSINPVSQSPLTVPSTNTLSVAVQTPSQGVALEVKNNEVERDTLHPPQVEIVAVAAEMILDEKDSGTLTKRDDRIMLALRRDIQRYPVLSYDEIVCSIKEYQPYPTEDDEETPSQRERLNYLTNHNLGLVML